MIAQLQGILLEKQAPELLLDVQGVGYELQVSMNTFYQLPELGEKLRLHTHFVVREDAHTLYGFADTQERSLFRTLIKVNGVGPKLALSLLSSTTPVEFTQHVMSNNATALTKLPGIGKKTAERLIIEMRDKLKDANLVQTEVIPGMAIASAKMAPAEEAMSALVALGYKSQDASKTISRLEKADLKTEDIIRLALQQLGK